MPEVEPTADAVYRFGDLEGYVVCPRRYFYSQVVGLGQSRDRSGYERFRRVVWRTLGWISSEREAGREPGPRAALDYLVGIWNDFGPAGDVYELVFVAEARAIIRRAASEAWGAGGRVIRGEVVVELPHGRVALNPDHCEIVAGNGSSRIELTHFRVGRPGKENGKDPIYGLYYRAAATLHPGGRVRVRAVYLLTGEERTFALSGQDVERGLATFDDAMAGIAAGRFEPRPRRHECARCPYFFVCPV